MISFLKLQESVIREKYKNLSEEELDEKVKKELSKSYNTGISKTKR